MKSILVFALAAVFFAPTFAQKSLEFNDVVNLKGDCTNGTHMIDTVPMGYTWKIENILTSNVSINLEPTPGAYMNISGSNYSYANVPPGSTNNASVLQPIWLKEGETLRAACSNSSNYRYFISILEFKITP